MGFPGMENSSKLVGNPALRGRIQAIMVASTGMTNGISAPPVGSVRSKEKLPTTAVGEKRAPPEERKPLVIGALPESTTTSLPSSSKSNRASGSKSAHRRGVVVGLVVPVVVMEVLGEVDGVVD